jgi:amidase
VTEILFAEARQRAQFLDSYLAKYGKPIGPLHGLPISLKDCFITPPHPSSVGIAAFANEPLASETLLVTILRDLGAVFYVKTNVSTAMMMMETNNNVWGETRNPLHKLLSPGGSSGGESALIAMKASPLGVGTDIGGSIRIPSAWCHLFGLKPSFGRFPTYGGRSGIPGQEFILAVNGPMARSLRSVQLYCETVLSPKVAPWDLDHKCLPIAWRRDVIQPKGRKLRLGMVGIDDGLVTCHPPVERALRVVRKTLEDSGHEIIPWSTPDHPEIVKNVIAAFFDLGGSAIMSFLEPHGEPVFESMDGYAQAAKAGESDLGPTKMRMMNLKRNALQKAYLDRWMATGGNGKEPMDGIIMAATPWAAARLGQTQKTLYVGYTGVFNLLGKNELQQFSTWLISSQTSRPALSLSRLLIRTWTKRET